MTAAPGPQQPDEVDVDCGHAWAEHDPEVGCLHADPAGPWLVVTLCRCKRTTPAAPSAQLDDARIQGLDDGIERWNDDVDGVH